MSRRKTEIKDRKPKRRIMLTFVECGNCGHAPGTHMKMPDGMLPVQGGAVTAEDLLDEARRMWCFGYPDPVGSCECRQFIKPEWA